MNIFLNIIPILIFCILIKMNDSYDSLNEVVFFFQNPIIQWVLLQSELLLDKLKKCEI